MMTRGRASNAAKGMEGGACPGPASSSRTSCRVRDGGTGYRLSTGIGSDSKSILKNLSANLGGLIPSRFISRRASPQKKRPSIQKPGIDGRHCLILHTPACDDVVIQVRPTDKQALCQWSSREIT